MLQHQTGLTHIDRDRATPGFTIFAPSFDEKVHLIDLDGNVVHDWSILPGGTNYNELLPNGNLWICETLTDGPPLGPGKGGVLHEYDWDGNLVWEHVDIDQHHDGRRLPNGGAVYIAWYEMDDDVAKQVQGGLPGSEHHVTGKIYGDVIREVDADGNVVFEWKTESLDFSKYPICPLCKREEYGHANTVSPLPNGDYLVSFRVLNLLIIIDRQTGQIKWEHHDIMLGHQHDCQMLENGNILVYANGYHTPVHTFSTALEFNPDTKEEVWKYRAKDNFITFFSPHISGVQRLENGNTLICEGGFGCLFEVTPDQEVVWEYISPYGGVHPVFGKTNWVFRAKRYAADSPQIQNRV